MNPVRDLYTDADAVRLVRALRAYPLGMHPLSRTRAPDLRRERIDLLARAVLFAIGQRFPVGPYPLVPLFPLPSHLTSADHDDVLLLERIGVLAVDHAPVLHVIPGPVQLRTVVEPVVLGVTARAMNVAQVAGAVAGGTRAFYGVAVAFGPVRLSEVVVRRRTGARLLQLFDPFGLRPRARQAPLF